MTIDRLKTINKTYIKRQKIVINLEPIDIRIDKHY